MKFTAMFLSVGILAVSGCTMTADDPYDIYTKTSVTGIPDQDLYYQGTVLFAVGEKVTVEDYCYTDASDAASAAGNHLKEFILENGVLNFGDRDCTCVDGACIRPAAVTSCGDSDDGKDIYTKGTVIGIHTSEDFVSEFSDYCDASEIVRMDEETGDMIRTGEFNLGKNLLEGFCTQGMQYDYEWIECEFGCIKGACQKGEPA